MRGTTSSSFAAVFGCLALVVAVLAAGSCCQALAPAVQIAAPEAGCTANVGDVLHVLVVVREGLDVSTVAVMCDGLGIGMLDSAPYSLEWNTAGFEPGDHALRAFLYLRSGEKVAADPVVIRLNQPAAPSAPAPVPAAAPTSALAAPTQSALPALGPVVLKEGTPILLETVDKLISGAVAEGSTVKFRVKRDVVGTNGELLIAYRDFAQGRVTRSRRRGMFGKPGQLEFTVETVEAVDGTVVPLRAQQGMQGKDNRSVVIASVLLISVLAVFVHGKDVEVPAGTEITAYVDHDVVVPSPRPKATMGGLQGAVMEQARLLDPIEGQSFRVGDDVRIAVDVAPRDRFASMAVYCDDQKIAERQGDVAPIVWNTSSASPGQHRIEAEVRFTNGRTIRTGAVTIELR